MRLFFSSSLELKAMQDIPDSVIEGGGVDGLTVTELCRKKREWVFMYQSNWSSHEQQDALTTLDVLFQSMFKDNYYLNKGLLAGVIPVMFGGISSGFNNYRDITMVPTDHSDLNFYSIVGSSEDNMARRDELVSSFGFNYSEVKSMVETVLTPYDCLCNRIDDVMRTIKQWYSGYQLGRFVGKYNPYSVCSYLTNLTKHIRPTQIYSDEDALELFKSCARNYWDLADPPELIERQMEVYPSEFCTIARELVKEYAEYSSLDPSASTSCETAVNLPYVKFRLSDTNTKYVNSGTFLSMALYTGYIAIRSPTTIGIPNGELWCVWESYLSQMNAKTSI
ncbi:hypothetical protein EV175_001487 [Coemansia sp. RSA 1933]|nr:hypothetical protein EV175_001487 [Coemansia sp. RSA 1933]